MSLPRGWRFANSFGAGFANPSLTPKATPGVTHVLTAVTGALLVEASPPQYAAQFQVVTPGGGFLPGYIFLPGGSGWETDSYTWTGEIPSVPNAALSVVYYGTVPTGGGLVLEIQGYDI